MLNHYPFWKNLLILFVLFFGIIYALSNLYGNDPAVQIASSTLTLLQQQQADDIASTSKNAGYALKAFEFDNGKILARFNNPDDQLKAADLLPFGFATGPVNGFALVLMIGIATSIFTAVAGIRILVN